MPDLETVPSRRVPLVHAYNMRELGGLPALDGRVVRRGIVFRAAGLHRLGDPDIETVRSLGLKMLVDLRTPGELQRHGEPLADLAARHVHLPMIPDIWDLRPLQEGEALEGYFVERYLEMLDLGAEAIARTLELLLVASHQPFGFFCAAGKDRTGVMTAVLLRLLGAADDTIVADYELSGPEMARLLAEVGDRERWATERMAGGGVPRLLTAPAEVMRRFLALLPEADRLASSFEMSPTDRAALADRLLDGSVR